MKNLNEIIKNIMKKYEGNEIIDILRNHNIEISCDIEEDINIWSEYMMNKGYSFIELMNMLHDEEYLKEDYEYIILDTDYNYPRFEAGFNYIDDLLKYVFDMKYIDIDVFDIDIDEA